MQRIYVVVDKVKEEVICCFMAKNDAQAIRENLGSLSRIMPLQDIEILEAGTICTTFGQEFVSDPSTPLPDFEKFELIKACLTRKIDLDSYKFPDPDSKVMVKQKIVEDGSHDTTEREKELFDNLETKDRSEVLTAN